MISQNPWKAAELRQKENRVSRLTQHVPAFIVIFIMITLIVFSFLMGRLYQQNKQTEFLNSDVYRNSLPIEMCKIDAQEIPISSSDVIISCGGTLLYYTYSHSRG